MTDWQQPLVVALTQTTGLSIVHETVYENRLGFTEALSRLGRAHPDLPRVPRRLAVPLRAAPTSSTRPSSPAPRRCRRPRSPCPTCAAASATSSPRWPPRAARRCTASTSSTAGYERFSEKLEAARRRGQARLTGRPRPAAVSGWSRRARCRRPTPASPRGRPRRARCSPAGPPAGGAARSRPRHPPARRPRGRRRAAPTPEPSSSMRWMVACTPGTVARASAAALCGPSPSAHGGGRATPRRRRRPAVPAGRGRAARDRAARGPRRCPGRTPCARGPACAREREQRGAVVVGIGDDARRMPRRRLERAPAPRRAAAPGGRRARRRPGARPSARGGTASGRDRGVEARDRGRGRARARRGRPTAATVGVGVTTSTGMPGTAGSQCGDGVAGEGVGEGGPRGAGQARRLLASGPPLTGTTAAQSALGCAHPPILPTRRATLDIAPWADHNAVTRPHGRQRVTTPTDHSRPFAYRFVDRPRCARCSWLLTRREWSGAEHLPTEGGFVVVHQPLLATSTRSCSATSSSTTATRRATSARSRSSGSRSSAGSSASADQIPVLPRVGPGRRRLPGGRRRRCAPARPSRSTPRAPSRATPTCGRCAARPARPASRSRPRARSIPVAQWGAQEILSPYGQAALTLPAQDDAACTPVRPSTSTTSTTAASTRGAARGHRPRIMAAITELLEAMRGEKRAARPLRPRAAPDRRPVTHHRQAASPHDEEAS